MAKSFKNYLSGQIGENLVAAELGRRGIVASILSGNMPDVDILAFRAGKSIGIQVKAFKTGSVSVNLADYLHIDLIDTVQHVRGIREASNPDLIYVIVKIGNMIGDDKFYVLRRLGSRPIKVIAGSGFH